MSYEDSRKRAAALMKAAAEGNTRWGYPVKPQTTKILVKGKPPTPPVPAHKCDLPFANKTRGYAPRELLGELRECDCGKFWLVISRRGHHYWVKISSRKARKIERQVNGPTEELQSPPLG